MKENCEVIIKRNEFGRISFVVTRISHGSWAGAIYETNGATKHSGAEMIQG
jgi:hypothetical protein